MSGQHTLDRRALLLVGREVIGDRDTPDHQDCAVDVNLTDHIGPDLLGAGRDMARFQRAGKRAQQSPTCGRDQVVQRRGVRMRDIGREAVVGGNLAMNAKEDRFWLSRQVRPADRALDPFHFDARCVSSSGHVVRSFHSGRQGAPFKEAGRPMMQSHQASGSLTSTYPR